ncbi:MAG: hypothetical protein OK454_03665 [Thaumarchaeota archaeon]|nr:hypothetical protein [Nitrososphaerota archaeon]
MADTKLKGLHIHRFKDNPEELRFAEAWDRQNREGKNFAYLLCGDNQAHPPEPTERDRVIGATVIQWLGSPVGQGFLKDLGYVKVKKPSRLPEHES